MNLQTELAATSVLLSLIRERYNRLRETAGEQMDPDDRKTAWLEATKLGSVSKVQGKPQAEVAYEQEFLDWVKREHPGEVTEAVRPGFRKKVLDECAANGTNANTNGEIVPGVQVNPREPYVKFTAATGAAEAVAEGWRNGTLQIPQLAELEKPE